MSLPAPGPARRKLPIGIQTFRKLREEGCYYVDKTPWIGRLVHEGDQYFLSRPRRFGKSLLLDTIKELFEGSEELFRGLAIHDRWDWTSSPVVRLSFGSGDFGDPDWLREDMAAQMDSRFRGNDGVGREAPFRVSAGRSLERTSPSGTVAT